MMIVAMFKGTFIIAFVHRSIIGLVFWIAGVPYTMFLTILSMFLSLVPLVGISLVAWPVAIILLLTGQIWQGVYVIAAFLIVIANIDTVLRPRLLPKGAYLNPALVILSVPGGLQLMGLIGALYGPVVMILNSVVRSIWLASGGTHQRK
jgi:predicted PurR-regulated permease PerM